MVDADVASSKEYTEFESKHNRHLNMMAESVSIFVFKKETGQESSKISPC